MYIPHLSRFNASGTRRRFAANPVLFVTLTKALVTSTEKTFAVVSPNIALRKVVRFPRIILGEKCFQFPDCNILRSARVNFPPFSRVFWSFRDSDIEWMTSFTEHGRCVLKLGITESGITNDRIFGKPYLFGGRIGWGFGFLLGILNIGNRNA